jgi:DNA polymerase
MLDSLTQITKDILQCQRCELRMNATKPVPGIGDVGAKYFLIGEAPGREEDESSGRRIKIDVEWIYFGTPFIGQAGRRLDKLLALAKIDPNDCYLSNVCRCRPPQNRNPKKKEIKACVDFLWRELKLVKPEIVILLGSTALSLFSDYGVTQLHGTEFEYEIPD